MKSKAPQGNPVRFAFHICLNNASRLRIALEGGMQDARLHRAYLAFDTGQEQEALVQLKLYLAWCVERRRDTCRGCGQVRGEGARLLTCSGKSWMMRHVRD